MAIQNVFFAHSGSQRYFVEAVAAASRHGVVHVLDLAAPLESPAYDAFRASYVHVSGKSTEYELWCFKRFFALLEYMEETGTPHGWLLDSDFLLLKPLPDPARFAEGSYCGLSIPGNQVEYEWVASAHCSWWTPEALRDFCDFATETYRTRADLLRDVYAKRKEHGVGGSISDMTLLHLWAREKNGRIANLFNFDEGGIIDHNLRTLTQPDGVSYKPWHRIKKLHFENGDVSAETVTGARIPLYGIHFQGKAKVLIPDLAAGNFGRFRAVAALRSAGGLYRSALLKTRGR